MPLPPFEFLSLAAKGYVCSVEGHPYSMTLTLRIAVMHEDSVFRCYNLHMTIKLISLTCAFHRLLIAQLSLLLTTQTIVQFAMDRLFQSRCKCVMSPAHSVKIFRYTSASIPTRDQVAKLSESHSAAKLSESNSHNCFEHRSKTEAWITCRSNPKASSAIASNRNPTCSASFLAALNLHRLRLLHWLTPPRDDGRGPNVMTE